MDFSLLLRFPLRIGFPLYVRLAGVIDDNVLLWQVSPVGSILCAVNYNFWTLLISVPDTVKASGGECLLADKTGSSVRNDSVEPRAALRKDAR